MARIPTKHRNKHTPIGRVSEEERQIIIDAWKDSGLGYTDFILLLVSYYRRSQMTPSQKRHSSRKEKR